MRIRRSQQSAFTGDVDIDGNEVVLYIYPNGGPEGMTFTSFQDYAGRAEEIGIKTPYWSGLRDAVYSAFREGAFVVRIKNVSEMKDEDMVLFEGVIEEIERTEGGLLGKFEAMLNSGGDGYEIYRRIREIEDKGEVPDGALKSSRKHLMEDVARVQMSMELIGVFFGDPVGMRMARDEVRKEWTMFLREGRIKRDVRRRKEQESGDRETRSGGEEAP